MILYYNVQLALLWLWLCIAEIYAMLPAQLAFFFHLVAESLVEALSLPKDFTEEILLRYSESDTTF